MKFEQIYAIKTDALVSMIARLMTSAEHTPSDPDDATRTLDRLIAEARELTGIDGPEAEEEGEEDDAPVTPPAKSTTASDIENQDWLDGESSRLW